MLGSVAFEQHSEPSVPDQQCTVLLWLGCTTGLLGLLSFKHRRWCACNKAIALNIMNVASCTRSFMTLLLPLLLLLLQDIARQLRSHLLHAYASATAASSCSACTSCHRLTAPITRRKF
jgi:hypothetical protein